MPHFEPASTDDPRAARLLAHYFTSRELGFTTHAGGYRIVAPDPAWFTPPRGVFLVVEEEGVPVGCGGIRRLADIDGAVTYEVKHLWLEEEARGRGWSRLLMSELEQRARDLGAELMVLDTNDSLVAAQELYRSSGYEDTAPYNDNRNATHWFRKRLTAG